MVHIIRVLISSLILLVRNREWRRKKIHFVLLYCIYSLKYLIFWKLLRIPLHEENIFNNKLQFFHYSIFLSLFEDLYLNDEYFVQLPKNPTIIDLGSEVGLSVFYFKTIYPTARVLAFEPDPESFHLLSNNVKNNKMKKVSCFNAAVANKVGSTSFYVDNIVPGSLTMSLSPLRQQKKITVHVRRLSSFIKKTVDLLKMDIEGAELDVLLDLSQKHKLKHIHRLIIEYHHHIDVRLDNLSRLLRVIEINGFGYQLQAKNSLPFQKEQYQDFLIFAYKKTIL